MINKLGLNLTKRKKGISEIQKKIFFVIFSLIIFRIGSFIPIPGVDVTILTKLLKHQSGTIIDIFNMFSGGALNRASIFSLGIMPYISSSIIIQLLTLLHPTFLEIKKEGESGHRKLNQYTRYFTLILAVVQSIGISLSLNNISGFEKLIIYQDFYFYLIAIFSLVTGTIFLMWLGELITDYGIGNGISIIIFSGIISGLPSAIVHTVEQARLGNLSILFFIILIVLMFSITFLVVFIEKSQRNIDVCYAKRQQGRRLYAAQSTHLPLKLNIAGVIPAIFASSIILFPATIISWFGGLSKWDLLVKISNNLQPNCFLYHILYGIFIIFFCFFYTGLVFNPRETADNLKKSGAFIPGIRPGEQTSKYINKIMLKLTLISSIYITFICLIPELIRNFLRVSFHFGGTSLLIVVVVIIDFISQTQTLILSTQYESVLKKSNLNFKHNSSIY